MTDELDQRVTTLQVQAARTDESARVAHHRLDAINGDLRSLKDEIAALKTSIGDLKVDVVERAGAVAETVASLKTSMRVAAFVGGALAASVIGAIVTVILER